MSTDLQVIDGTAVEPSLLFAAASPDAMMTLAAETAQTIKQAIDRQHLSMKIGASEHVLNSGWQMAANTQRIVTDRDQGVTEIAWPMTLVDQVRGEDDHPLKRAYRLGQAFGYKASFFAKRDGQTVGWGEARCDRTEANWRRSENNAIASMAQTRAQSKALKQPLAWVITLAGYSPTPADEMADTTPSEPVAPVPASDELEAAALAALRRTAPSSYSALDYFDLLRKNFDGIVPEIAARAIVGLGRWIDQQERRAAETPPAAPPEPTPPQE